MLQLLSLILLCVLVALAVWGLAQRGATTTVQIRSGEPLVARRDVVYLILCDETRLSTTLLDALSAELLAMQVQHLLVPVRDVDHAIRVLHIDRSALVHILQAPTAEASGTVAVATIP